MKRYSSREVIKITTADGWYEVHCVGDHHQFKHPTKPGRVTVTHTVKDIAFPTLKNIAKQAGGTSPCPRLLRAKGASYMENYYAYPAFFYYDEAGISIEFPDLPGCLPCAETQEAAFRNAREALGLHLYGMEQDCEPIPAPSSIDRLQVSPGAVVVMVEVFMPSIRERLNNKSVNRTVTLPAWLNAAAVERSINFSQVLQDALKAQIGAI